ncbi:hypothetical protein PS870_01750 [Pseudomonas fluorescens]|uniref:Phage tail protein n=2 Tax=Pseudomonas fluorescens TaxID=294 RepID=A0A5E7IVN5_PSEFL|nr:hypothetical protein PS870_01750 [Pseudomonas fluorescens]
MIIKLAPQRRDESFEVTRSGDVLVVRGVSFDFSPIKEGDTLPRSAIKSEWFAGDVDRIGGELVLTLLFPNPWNYSQEQAFPIPLVNVPNGLVRFPQPLSTDLPTESVDPLPTPEPGSGLIDWSLLVTAEMKAAALAAAQLAEAKSELASKNLKAVTQIARLQDRIDTLGYGIGAGEATDEDEAEQVTLLVILKAWKAYKFALGKVTVQPTWYAAPVWPTEPVVPVIVADPEARSADLM